MIRGQPRPTLFPYTTLFRSGGTVVLGPGFQGGAITNLTLSGTTLINTLPVTGTRSEEHTSELQSRGQLVCRHMGIYRTGNGVFGQAGLVNNTNYWLWVQSGGVVNRSEERRVGKEGRLRWSGYHEKKK